MSERLPRPMRARRGRKEHRLVRRVALSVGAIVIVWAGMSYLILPFALRHYEHQTALDGLQMVTHTSDGLAGDPLNVGIVGTRDELVTAMAAADWSPADPVTLRTSIEIIGSVVFDEAYRQAPVSPLFYQGRRQDLAFEKEVGHSADRRQHVRFWTVLSAGMEGRPVWLGSASLDVGVGLSHYTGEVTHAISPDVDAMRDKLAADLAATGHVAEVYEVTGVGFTVNGRNGEGDRYYTDGEIRFSVLAGPGATGRQPPPVRPNPPLVDLKNALWHAASN